MGMTMTQKILAAKAGREAVEAGELIEAQVDLVLGNDITAPVAIDEMERFGQYEVFDRTKIALVLDHFVPNKDIKAAQQCKKVRDFARKHRITHFYDVGRMGVEHALLPEQGLCAPGELIIGADSHTCTYGALGAFSTGVGSTDMAYAMARGKCWLKIPPAIRFVLRGQLARYCSGKDVILKIIGTIGVDGARYQSMEFAGEGARTLSVDDRLTICNMAVEAGAKNGIFETDAKTTQYLAQRVKRPYTAYTTDSDAHYEATYEIDLGEIEPFVAAPHLPENVAPASSFADVALDQVVIGSCTNGRFSDMRAAAEILRGNRVKEGLRVIVIPATQEVYKQCITQGLAEIFVEAGCAISTPTCGPCLGGYMGILADNEVCLATTNRNFVGRMGAQSAKVYLSSPTVAAASALTGRITSPASL